MTEYGICFNLLVDAKDREEANEIALHIKKVLETKTDYLTRYVEVDNIEEL